MKIRAYIILAAAMLWLCPPAMAQNKDSGLRQQKEQELKAVLRNKDKTMSDIAKFIPYDIPLVNRSFYEWTKQKVVFYKDGGNGKVPVEPGDIDGNIKADYEKNLTLQLPESYFEKWHSYFDQLCYDSNEGQAVMDRFFRSQIDLGTCLEKFGRAENTSSYVQYIKRLVFTALNTDRGNWQKLFDFYQGLKDSKAKTCLGAMLCRTTPEVKKWVAVMKLFPHAKAYYYGAEDESYASDKDILGGATVPDDKSHDAYGGCLSGFVLYPDGRIIMRRTADECEYSERMKQQTDALMDVLNVYLGQDYTFMYDPKGEILLGLLKIKGSSVYYQGKVQKPVLWKSTVKHVPSETFDLVCGCKFNADGTFLTDEYFEKSSAQAAREYLGKQEQYDKGILEYVDRRREQQRQEEINNAYGDYYNQLSRKYGSKAALSVMQLEIYVGMPEGLLREFIFYSPDTGNGMKVFYQLGAGERYSIYAYNITFRQLLGGRYAHCRIFCQGGKISWIDYNYYGPF